jgi:DNA-binding response OmpR family regulator
MKILVVEDNHHLAELLAKYFKLQKHICHVASGGQIAISMMQTQIYDLVFLDLAMPGFTGYEVIEELKINDSIKNQKIIVLTAVTLNSSDREFLMNQGVHMVLQKPIPLHELIDYVTQNYPTP